MSGFWNLDSPAMFWDRHHLSAPGFLVISNVIRVVSWPSLLICRLVKVWITIYILISNKVSALFFLYLKSCLRVETWILWLNSFIFPYRKFLNLKLIKVLKFHPCPKVGKLYYWWEKPHENGFYHWVVLLLYLFK